MRVQADHLQKKFGWTTALENLSLEIQPGQILALLGPNGAGKTTLLNALAGCISLDAGQVLMDGEVYGPDRIDLRRRLAFIPDIPPVQSGWSPIRFISTALKLYGLENQPLEERILEVLRELDLLPVAGWKFRQLSRGQLYKAVLAAFIVADPELWLVDEPFASGMDPRGLNCFKNYARQAVARGRTIVFTTQIIEVAEHFADRVCILDHGRIEAQAEAGELRELAAWSALLSQLSENPVK